jgi:hypothetical protein
MEAMRTRHVRVAEGFESGRDLNAFWLFKGR